METRIVRQIMSSQLETVNSEIDFVDHSTTTVGIAFTGIHQPRYRLEIRHHTSAPTPIRNAMMHR